MAPAGGRDTLRVMSIKRVVRLPRRWWGAAGVALVTVLAVVGAYVEANPAHRYGGLHLTSHPPLAAYLLLAVPAVALIWRNSRPVEVFALAVAGAVGWAALGQIDGAALVPVLVALYWVALSRPRRIAVAAGLTGAAAIFLAEGLLGPFGWLGGPNATMWPELLAAGAVGAYVAARRQWLAAESARAAQAEQAREDETRRRVDAERMRIARELHDVVAHSISVMTVQAGGARLLVESEPVRAEEALLQVEETGRLALAEMRRLPGVLGRDGRDDGGGPRAGLTSLAWLLEQVRCAGLPVELIVSGSERPLPAGLDLAAYRVVQEALTNTLKHAGPAIARVRLRYAPEALELEVEDDGPGTGTGGGGGHGLVGMRERVTIYGGELRAGRRPDGGYGVRVRLPLERTGR
jgi:signal transduction histidine kinase